MKTLKPIFLSLIALCIAFSACKKDDPPYEEKEEIEIDLQGNKSDGSKVAAQASSFGSVPDHYLNGFNERIKSVVSGYDKSSQMAITAMGALSDDVAGMLDNGATIIVVNPEAKALNSWLEKQGYGISFSEDNIKGNSVLAFNVNGDIFSMSGHTDKEAADERFADQLNEFVSWAQEILTPKVMGSGISDDDIQQYTEGTTLSNNKSLSLSIDEAKPVASTAKTLTGTATITVRNTIYPLYVIEGQSAAGDYYIVHTELSIANANAYKKGVWQWGWVKAPFQGFYQKSLDITTTLKDTTGNKVGTFAKTPEPVTVSNVTSYTSGVEWGINGSVRFNVGVTGKNKKAADAAVAKEADVDKKNPVKLGFDVSVSGGVTFKNTQSQTISDMNINNASDGNNVVRYIVEFNNLPYCKLSPIELSDCPAVARTTATVSYDWVWHVPSTKNFDDTSAFTLHTEVNSTHASCHFYSTRADFVEHETKSNYSFDQVLPQPDRTPRGRIVITNSHPSKYLSDFVVKDKSGKVVYTNDQGSVADDEAIQLYLVPGDYNIEMKIGENRATADTYKNAAAIKVTHGNSIFLHSDYDFVKE